MLGVKQIRIGVNKMDCDVAGNKKKCYDGSETPEQKDENESKEWRDRETETSTKSTDDKDERIQLGTEKVCEMDSAIKLRADHREQCEGGTNRRVLRAGDRGHR